MAFGKFTIEPSEELRQLVAELRELVAALQKCFEPMTVKSMAASNDAIIVLRFPGKVSPEALASIRDQARNLFGGRKVMVLDGGADVDVMEPEASSSKYVEFH
jgi:hypothetical protein